jgi:hypothetical protein
LHESILSHKELFQGLQKIFFISYCNDQTRQVMPMQLTSVAFGEDGDQPFDGPEDGSVDDDGGLLLALVVDVSQSEPETKEFQRFTSSIYKSNTQNCLS